MTDQERQDFIAHLQAKNFRKEDIFTALARIDTAEDGEHAVANLDKFAAPVVSGKKPPAPDMAEAEAAARSGQGERALMDGGTQEQRARMNELLPDAEAHNAAVDFARFSMGGLSGMGASQLAQRVGLGGRTAGAIGGAVGGVLPAASDPNSKPMDIMGALLMGGAMGAAGAPRGQRDMARSPAGRATNAVERVGPAQNEDTRSQGPIYSRARPIGAPGGTVAAEVGAFRPAQGGMFDEPSYRALPEGPPGTQQMADQARAKITEGLAARDAANRGALDATEARVEAELGDTLHPHEPLDRRIAQARTENNNTRGGEPRDPSIEARLADVERQLTPPEDDPTPGATFGQLRGLQKSLAEGAQYDQPGSMENRVPRMLHGAATDSVKALHPDLPPAYERYGAEAQALEDAKNALYGGHGTVRDPEDLAMTNEERARTRLARYGAEGHAAANSGLSLDKMAAQDPAYRRELDRLGARNAQDLLTMRLTMPGGSGISQGLARTLGHNLGAISERLVRPATGIGYHGPGPSDTSLQLAPLIELLMHQEKRK